MQKIMIDGVNVAECEYLEEDYFTYDLIGEKHLEHNKCMIISAYEDIITDCSQCTNCYFKQLQRLKAENQKAIKKVRDYIKEICKEECDYTKPKFCGDCDCRYGQILDIIESEARAMSNETDYELLKSQYNAVVAQNRELQKQNAELNTKLEKIREYCDAYSIGYIKPVLQTIAEMAEEQ